MESQHTGIVRVLRWAWPGQLGVGAEIRKFFMEAVVTCELSLERLLLIRQIWCGKGVLGPGTCLSQGLEVKKVLAWRGSLWKGNRSACGRM